MAKRKEIKFKKVFYQRNIDLSIDPDCNECISHHIGLSGYLQLNRDGFRQMHRWIFWKATGDKHDEVMHLCDNPKCININHLKAGTHLDNMHDMVSKGRSVKGEKNHNHKLTELDIRYIRLWLELGYTCRDVAKNFKVNENHISKIKNNRRWAGVV